MAKLPPSIEDISVWYRFMTTVCNVVISSIDGMKISFKLWENRIIGKDT